MARGTEVPITPEVLEWAIDESGYSDEQLADEIGVSLDILEQWKKGGSRPNLTQFKKLSSKLHRQRATFLVPEPPQTPEVELQFRDIFRSPSEGALSIERRYVRRAERMLGYDGRM